jgi:hypothetical protein
MPEARIVLLCTDHELRRDLKRRLGPSVVIDHGRLFYDLDQELRREVAEAIAVLSQGRGAWWWEGQIASKSSSANPFYKHIVFFFMALRGLTSLEQHDLIFIVQSPLLGSLIEREAREQGLKVLANPLLGKLNLRVWQIRSMVRSTLKVLVFGILALKRRYQYQNKGVSSAGLMEQGPKVLIRTWVTEGNYSAQGFEERIFGPLMEHLRKKGKQVILYPMFVKNGLGLKIFCQLYWTV